MPLFFPLPVSSVSASANNSNSAATRKFILAFRECLERFLLCAEYSGSQNLSGLGELAANYQLDFDLCGRKALSADDQLYRLFQLHFLEGCNTSECGTLLGKSAFTIASQIVHIERLVGRTLLQRGLSPLHKYFGDIRQSPSQLAA
jgi:hypothetical protein